MKDSDKKAQPLMELPTLVMTDIDGVWTDGGMYYDRHGNETKKFNTSDSAGVLFLRSFDIPLAILTGEKTEMVANRAAKLRIEHLYQGVSDKVAVATELCESLGTSLDRVGYIGDDLNDVRLLSVVGFSAAPANAPTYVKDLVDVVTTRAGGEGAFREFIETMLTRCGKLDDAIADVVGVQLSELSNWQ